MPRGLCGGEPCPGAGCRGWRPDSCRTSVRRGLGWLKCVFDLCRVLMPKQCACLRVCPTGLSVGCFLHEVVWFCSSLEGVWVAVSPNTQRLLSPSSGFGLSHAGNTEKSCLVICVMGRDREKERWSGGVHSVLSTQIPGTGVAGVTRGCQSAGALGTSGSCE